MTRDARPELDELKRENRDLRLFIGAMLNRADGRIEVTDAEIVNAEHTDVVVWRDHRGDRTVVVASRGGTGGAK